MRFAATDSADSEPGADEPVATDRNASMEVQEEPETNASVQQLVENLARGVIVPSFETFSLAATTLASSAKDFEKAPTHAKFDALRSAWQATWLAWKSAVPCLVPPENAEILSQELASFPIDEAAVEALARKREPLSTEHIAALGSRQKGLLTLEYVLYDQDGGTKKAFATLTKGVQGTHRRALLTALSRGVASSALALKERWDPSDGPALRAFLRPNSSGSPYPDAQAALDAMISRMVSLVELLKDSQLREPMHDIDNRRPELIEGHRSDQAIAALIAQIEAIHRLYDGANSRPGLRQRVEMASPELHESLAFAFDRSVHNLRAIPPPLDQAIFESEVSISKAYNVMGTLRDRLAAHLVATFNSNLSFGGFDGD